MTTSVRRSVRLDGLKLGAPAAERDPGLDHYFVESDAFRRVQDGSKTIIVGNRGVGKSAIFKMLTHRAGTTGAKVIELSPEDHSYELLEQTLLREKQGSWAKAGAFAAAWKYMIYVLVMKEVCAKKFALKKSAANGLYRYIRDRHHDAEMSKFSLLISYLKRLEGVKLGSFDFNLKARKLDQLYKLEEISGLLPDLKEVLDSRPVYVLVDELDRGWDASEDAQAFVAGLFQACTSVNQLSPNLRVYMSLRQELYDNIPSLYDDAQKYRDIIEKVSWNQTALLDLIAKRVQYSVPGLRDADPQKVWEVLFEDTLGYRNCRSFNYIVERTLYRPRELIQFCSDAIETAAMEGAPLPMDYSVISLAERKYSADRAKDIASEYRFQYPGLLPVFDAFRGRPYLFHRDELEVLCLELIFGEISTGAETADWLPYVEPEKLIEILWGVGFLRARSVGGIRGQRRSGSSYLGPHQVQNLSLDNIKSFQVHPMFRSYLAMKEPRG